MARNSQKNFSSKINIEAGLQIGDILKKISEIKRAMSSNTKVSPFLPNIEEEITNIETLYKRLQGQIGKGIGSPKENSAFQKDIGELSTRLKSVQDTLESLNSEAVNFDTKEFESSLDEIKKYAETTVTEIQKMIEKSINGLKIDPNQKIDLLESVRGDTKDLPKTKQIVENITKDIDEQIAQKEKIIALDRERAEVEKKTVLEDAVDSNKKGAKIKQFDATLISRDKKGYDTSVRGLAASNGIIGSTMNLEGEKKVNSLYKDVITDLARTGATAEDVFSKLSDVVKEKFNYQLIESDRVTSGIQADLKKLNTEKISATLGRVSKASPEANSASKSIVALNKQKSSVEGVVPIVEGATERQQNVKDIANERAKNLTRTYVDQNRVLSENRILVEKTSSELDNLASSTQEASSKQQDLDNSFENMKNMLKYTLSLANGWQMLKNVIRSTFSDLKELDAAFASIAMVTDYSVEDMWSSYDDYAAMANRLGQSTKDVIASSALFYQQGRVSVLFI